MKVREFEIYNAVYCGLCRHMGKTYGALSKLCLSYDMTFVSLLQMAVRDGCCGYEQRKCRVNPLKKCTYCKDDRSEQELAAAAAVVLTDLKVRDNISDSGILKALPFRLARIFTRRWSKKAYKKYPALENVVSEYADGQAKAERTDGCGLDAASEPTAKAVSRILSMVECDGKYRFVFERMGYCLGKWIYLCDVADDIEDDIKKGGFNPLAPEIPVGADPKNYAESRLTPLMNTCWTECANYFELLKPAKYKSIIDNILYDGMKHRQQKIFKKETEE